MRVWESKLTPNFPEGRETSSLEAGVARTLYSQRLESSQVLEIARAVRDEGGRALLVGGCVRDELMGQRPKAWDLEVYGIQPERLRELLDQFGSVNVVGEAFTVYKLGADLDVSVPRRERKTGRGHAGFIEGDPRCLEEADVGAGLESCDPARSMTRNFDPFKAARIGSKLCRVSPDTVAEEVFASFVPPNRTRLNLTRRRDGELCRASICPTAAERIWARWKSSCCARNGLDRIEGPARTWRGRSTVRNSKRDRGASGTGMAPEGESGFTRCSRGPRARVN